MFQSLELVSHLCWEEGNVTVNFLYFFFDIRVVVRHFQDPADAAEGLWKMRYNVSSANQHAISLLTSSATHVPSARKGESCVAGCLILDLTGVQSWL